MAAQLQTGAEISRSPPQRSATITRIAAANWTGLQSHSFLHGDPSSFVQLKTGSSPNPVFESAIQHARKEASWHVRWELEAVGVALLTIVDHHNLHQNVDMACAVLDFATIANGLQTVVLAGSGRMGTRATACDITVELEVEGDHPGLGYHARMNHPRQSSGQESVVCEMSFTLPEVSVVEDEGEGVVIVHRTGSTSESALVSYQTIDGTAVAGVHYVAGSGVLEFPAGVAELRLRIPLCGPGESDRQFSIVLFDPESACVLGNISSVSVNVIDRSSLPDGWTAKQTNCGMPYFEHAQSGAQLWSRVDCMGDLPSQSGVPVHVTIHEIKDVVHADGRQIRVACGDVEVMRAPRLLGSSTDQCQSHGEVLVPPQGDVVLTFCLMEEGDDDDFIVALCKVNLVEVLATTAYVRTWLQLMTKEGTPAGEIHVVIQVADSAKAPGERLEESNIVAAEDPRPASREDEQDVATWRTHEFVTATFCRPTFCDHCHSMIFGVIQQGQYCAACGFDAHHKCAEMVATTCHAFHELKNPTKEKKERGPLTKGEIAICVVAAPIIIPYLAGRAGYAFTKNTAAPAMGAAVGKGLEHAARGGGSSIEYSSYTAKFAGTKVIGGATFVGRKTAAGVVWVGEGVQVVGTRVFGGVVYVGTKTHDGVIWTAVKAKKGGEFVLDNAIAPVATALVEHVVVPVSRVVGYVGTKMKGGVVYIGTQTAHGIVWVAHGVDVVGTKAVDGVIYVGIKSKDGIVWTASGAYHAGEYVVEHAVAPVVKTLAHGAEVAGVAFVENVAIPLKHGAEVVGEKTIDGVKYVGTKTAHGVIYVAHGVEVVGTKAVGGVVYVGQKTKDGIVWTAHGAYDHAIEPAARATKHATVVTAAVTYNHVLCPLASGAKFAGEKTIDGVTYVGTKTASGVVWTATQTAHAGEYVIENAVVPAAKATGKAANTAAHVTYDNVVKPAGHAAAFVGSKVIDGTTYLGTRTAHGIVYVAHGAEVVGTKVVGGMVFVGTKTADGIVWTATGAYENIGKPVGHAASVTASTVGHGATVAGSAVAHGAVVTGTAVVHGAEVAATSVKHAGEVAVESVKKGANDLSNKISNF